MIPFEHILAIIESCIGLLCFGKRNQREFALEDYRVPEKQDSELFFAHTQGGQILFRCYGAPISIRFFSSVKIKTQGEIDLKIEFWYIDWINLFPHVVLCFLKKKRERKKRLIVAELTILQSAVDAKLLGILKLETNSKNKNKTKQQQQNIIGAAHAAV